MKFDLEKVRSIVYGDSLFLKWCALNYLKDLYRKTGVLKDEWDYISSFYPEEEYIYDYFLRFETFQGRKTIIMFVKHLSFDIFLPLYEYFDPLNKQNTLASDDEICYLGKMDFDGHYIEHPFHYINEKVDNKTYYIKEHRKEKDASYIFYSNEDMYISCIPRKDNFFLTKENTVCPLSHNTPWSSYFTTHIREDSVKIEIP